MAYPKVFEKGDVRKTAHNASEMVKLEWDGYREVSPEQLAEEQAEQADAPAETPATPDKPEQTDAEKEAELEQARADAEAAGVEVDGRWGVKRLQEETEAAKAKAAADQSTPQS